MGRSNAAFFEPAADGHDAVPPRRPREQAGTDAGRAGCRDPDDPPLMRPRLASQHILDELLASRHLIEALLIGGNAPYFLVGQRRAFMTSCFLLHVEAVDLSLETHHMPRGIPENVALARTEKLGWADA